MDIKNTLLTSLRKLSRQHTEETLGDRRHYLGASDIGYCPRKVILDRLHPTEHDLATLLRFQRGHMVEDIVASAFIAAGYANFERQVELDISTESVSSRVHIDFVFTSAYHKIKSVLEVKSGQVPDGPYSSWESQLYLQIGALANRYPNYAVKGAILSIDLATGEVGFFNGYTPQQTLYNGLLARAELIWTSYQQACHGGEPEMETEPGPLCGFCSHIKTCSRFRADDIPEMDDYISQFQELKKSEKELKSTIELRKNILLTMVRGRGAFRAGGMLLSERTRTRTHLDMPRLEEFLAEHGSTMSAFQEPSSFSYLEIRKAQ